ncbi:hypothetical protein BH11ACT5_BH11ACT5_21180 [soil metagenome]
MNRVEAHCIVLTSRLAAQFTGGSALELELAVTLPTGIRMPVAHASVVARADRARVRPGAALAVTLDPDRPDTLAIDWSRAA